VSGIPTSISVDSVLIGLQLTVEPPTSFTQSGSVHGPEPLSDSRTGRCVTVTRWRPSSHRDETESFG